MADFPEPMLAGSIAVAGNAPLLLTQGATYPIDGSVSANLGNKTSDKAMCCHTITKALSVVELQKNVTTALGYVPGGVTVIGFKVDSDDLDTGTPAIIQSLILGSTTLVTGIDTGKAGTIKFYACIPTETTEPTLVHMKVTTVAATIAAGDVRITVLYYSS